MSNKRKIVDVEMKCRLCLGDEGCMSYLFDETLKKKLDNITKCTAIVIKEDEALPDKICHVCLYKLDSWNEFKEQFVKSNEVLLTRLAEPGDADNSIIDDNELNNLKRKLDDSQASGTESLSDRVLQKKVKNAAEQPTEKTIEDHVEDEPLTMSLKKELEITGIDDGVIVKEEVENDNEGQSQSKEINAQAKLSSISTRGRWFGGRRGKTTAKRKASTRRWVARKRALLAATGENASDTDSIISDNESKLSPVQKARAKTNADKEVEKQKRLAKALKNLETDMKGVYGNKYENDVIVIQETDSEGKAHKTRSQKKCTIENVSINETKNSTNSARSENENENKDEEATNEKENRNVVGKAPPEEQVTNLQNEIRESEEESLIDRITVFSPQLVKSKLELGDATYIVTSTLVLSEPHYPKGTTTKDSSKDENGLNVDENSQERNTDIIDAVQLRRINPKSTDDNDDTKHIERCLNIEVEGTELEALQRVQSELAAFVEKDMSDRLRNEELMPKVKKSQSKSKDSSQSLDQQLKTIVEKAIMKNIEMSNLKKNPFNKTSNIRNKKTFSAAFVKAAMKSKLFQPRVEITRLNLKKASKRYKINNISIIQSEKPKERDIRNQNTISNEMKQTNSLLRYGSFKFKPMETDNIVTSDDQIVTSTPRTYTKRLELKSEIPRTNDPSLRKLSSPPKGPKKVSMSQQVLQTIRNEFPENVNIKRVEKPICETVECDTTTKTLPSQPVVADKPKAKKVKFSKTHKSESIDLEDPNQRKHFCGICKETFATFNDMEVHIKSHKPASVPEVLPTAKKPRMMRCKRCHEVVDAKLVRAHTCRLAKYHKCYVCNSTFRTEKMLVSHIQTHDGSEFNVEKIEHGETTKKSSNVITSTQETIAHHVADSNTTSNELAKKQMVVIKESYTCFVCDKKFTDDEVLKDHLQQHCNDVSEEDASSGKEEQYQCAICGDTLESEDALEMHVEKHLCDDQDDNPNLINISNDSDQNKEIEDTFKCSQCTKVFNSEMLLAMHMQAHEEEAAIAIWEKESTAGMKAEEEYFCAICEETFQTEEQIIEHLDAHNGNAHVCFLCEKPFLSLADLQLHVESH